MHICHVTTANLYISIPNSRFGATNTVEIHILTQTYKSCIFCINILSPINRLFCLSIYTNIKCRISAQETQLPYLTQKMHQIYKTLTLSTTYLTLTYECTIIYTSLLRSSTNFCRHCSVSPFILQIHRKFVDYGLHIRNMVQHL